MDIQSTQAQKMAELTITARQKLGLSQRKFAEYLKQQGLLISFTTIQDMEKARIGKIKLDYWKIIAPLAGYTLENAITYIAEENLEQEIKNDPKEQAIKTIAMLSSEDLQDIAKIITERLAVQKLPEIAKIITERFERELNFKRAA
jgi:transcriptional regulator with XRE-family HTH domain